MPTDPGRVAELLLEIEAEMRACGLWSASRPPDQALRSRMPFCY
jgi:uncharacterized protein YqcC (DUF446 family)